MMSNVGKPIAAAIGVSLTCTTVLAQQDPNVERRTEIDRLRALNVELTGRLREKEMEVQRLQIDLQAARRRGQTLSDQLAGDVLARIHEILPPSKRSCENIQVSIDENGSVYVSGRLTDVDQFKRRLADARPGGIAINTDELERLTVCGHPIGDGWIIETAENGWRLAALRELESDIASRLPQGSDETCQALGGKIDALDRSDSAVRRAFWALRPGTALDPRFGYCEPSAVGAEWRYSEIDVPHLRGLVVQRSP